MDELCQLYADDGKMLSGKGAPKRDIFKHGLLHGASHVWVWRRRGSVTEVLVQKRSTDKPTWPNKLHISAGGHIGVGESPMLTALRETKEEIGLDLDPAALHELGPLRVRMSQGEIIENELVWAYLTELPQNSTFSLQESEVDSIFWEQLDDFARACTTDQYVPYGAEYYAAITAALRAVS